MERALNLGLLRAALGEIEILLNIMFIIGVRTGRVRPAVGELLSVAKIVGGLPRNMADIAMYMARRRPGVGV